MAGSVYFLRSLDGAFEMHYRCRSEGLGRWKNWRELRTIARLIQVYVARSLADEFLRLSAHAGSNVSLVGFYPPACWSQRISSLL